MRSLPIHKHGISLHLFISPISFISANSFQHASAGHALLDLSLSIVLLVIVNVCLIVEPTCSWLAYSNTTFTCFFCILFHCEIPLLVLRRITFS